MKGVQRDGDVLVVVSCFPEREQQDGELAGDGDDGAFLGGFSSASGEAQSGFAECGGRAEWAEDVVGAVDEETAQLGVAGFGDGELLVGLAGLVASGDESEVGADVAGAGESLGVFEGEDEAEGGDGADTGDLLEALGDGVLGLGEGFELLFKGFDLAVEMFKAQEQRFDEGTVDGLELEAGLFRKGTGFDAGGQENAEAFNPEYASRFNRRPWRAWRSLKK